jgi:nitronate monooxygenase
MMAANAPMMIQEAMVKGKPDHGILPSGQVAGLIDDLPAVDQLLTTIMRDAEGTLARMSTLSEAAGDKE